ncbi:RNA/RNP complex-1-interacting phosphatase [Amphibalanus amphitrite]|uniref:RNA/RNP complex-1-interacting phosphatase n=1 Tax=Amphibalanus amphitrite TaxID=1232801 RepID=A0A6A4VEJ8_AMPAM|nr:RNA/RNP complex-1-interacting phosphatase [Amphibalanus amphitrite]
MGKNGIPDRWLDYSNFGDVIEGTRIVALKVPLKEVPAMCRCQSSARPTGGARHTWASTRGELGRAASPAPLARGARRTGEVLLNKVQQKERFSPQMATDGIPKLDYVIDLTYTKRYYSPHEFQSRGIGHSKIATEGHVIPNGAVMRRFFDTMDSYLADDRRTGVIGVHCTHGVNRTGYMVCRYMISKLGFAPDQAIAAFNKARGHDLERANYLMDLRAGNWPELPEAVPEEPPEPAVESDRRREPWTPADQRRQRREERRRGAAPFPWPPPAGHRWHRPPGPPRFWRPPPPWAGPDWRPRGPPPPWVWPGGGEGWRHGPPPPRPPPHDDGPSREARDGPPQDTDDQWQPEPRPVAADDPPPSAERPPPSADRGHDRPPPTGTRMLSIASERCPVVAETGAPTELIVLRLQAQIFCHVSGVHNPAVADRRLTRAHQGECAGHGTPCRQ